MTRETVERWTAILEVVLSGILFIFVLCQFCKEIKQAHEQGYEEGCREAFEQMKLEPPMIKESDNE